MCGAPKSLTTSLSRLRTRLRSAALPTFFVTVKPTRTGPPTSRLSACNTNAAVATLTPLAAARKSVRRRNRSMERRRAGSGAEPLAATRAARGEHPTAALGLHARAETVTALAHQLARLIGPLHGSFSAERGAPPIDGWRGAGATGSAGWWPPRPKTAICRGRRLVPSPAAYKGGSPCSSMQARSRARPSDRPIYDAQMTVTDVATAHADI